MITFEQEDLTNVLSLLSKNLKPNSVMDTYSFFQVSAMEDKVLFCAENAEISIVCGIRTILTDTFNLLVHPKMNNFVSSLNKKGTIDVYKSDNHLTVKQKKTKANLVTKVLEEEIKVPEPSNAVKIKSRDITEAIDKLTISSSFWNKTSLRLADYIKIEKKDGLLVFYRADNVQVYKSYFKEDNLPDCSFLVTADSLKYLSLVLRENPAEYSFFYDENFIYIYQNDIFFVKITLQKEIQYPDIGSIQIERNYTVKTNKEFFRNALMLAVLLDRQTPIIGLTFSANEILIVSKSEEGELFYTSVVAESDIEIMELGVNGLWINEAVKKLESDELVIHIKDEKSPIMIEEEGFEYTIALMTLDSSMSKGLIASIEGGVGV